MEESVSFSKQMRVHTRKIHKISDLMVNAKMVFALQDPSVWGDGLLVFYEIFRFLENNVSTDILPPNYYRAEAFEKDLNFYIGADWKKKYSPRPSVCAYLNHLQQLQRENPTLLLAYVYHLYMGLLSGGQILAKKRQLGKYFANATPDATKAGAMVTTFENDSIADLKNAMRSSTDTLAATLNENTKQLLLEESIKVFELNNELIRSVRGANQMFFRQIGMVVLVILTIFLFFKLWKI